MIAERMPVYSRGFAKLAYPRALLIHPSHFLAAQYGDLVPKFRQANEVRQNLRLAERIGQAIVGDVKSPAGTLGLGSSLHGYAYTPSVSPMIRILGDAR